VLDEFHEKHQIDLVIQGGARGADSIAAAWAHQRGIGCEQYEADWTTYGRSAGAIRNQRMITEGKPEYVIAFPGGRGTADMVGKAARNGIPVLSC
jgi:predicted polyphosphate/ATP-dependent NAD kinase